MLDQFGIASFEAAARQFEPVERQWATPGELARHLDPTVKQTAALDLIDAELVRLMNEPGGRLIVSMPPQQGKSSRISQVFPVWALTENPKRSIIVASYGEDLAERNGETIRNMIEWNNLGITVMPGSAAKKRWKLTDGGGVLSAGVGSGMTGWRSDLTIVDDPIKNQDEADSPTYRERVWNWWQTVALTRLGPGAPAVVVLTRWHEDDLAGRLIGAEDGHRWRVINIPAQADHEPDKGESDILGREPGQYMPSVRERRDEQTGRVYRMTDRDWEQVRVAVGSRAWQAMYQGRPSPAGGGLLKTGWWKRYDTPLWTVRDDGSHVVPGDGQIIMSWDMTFKDTASSDYVVGGVWLRRGSNAYLLDMVRGRWDFPETIRRFLALCAKWPQATLKVVEDKANGTAVIAQLRNQIPGLVPEQVHDSKVTRVNAIAPLVEAGNVLLPGSSLAAWSDDLIEEAAGFPTGKHDDMVDMTTQAVNRLLISPLIEETTDSTDMWDDYEDLGYYATPF